MLNREAIKNNSYPSVESSFLSANQTRSSASIKDLSSKNSPFGHLIDFNLSQAKASTFGNSTGSAAYPASSQSSHVVGPPGASTGYPSWCVVPAESKLHESNGVLPALYVQIWRRCRRAENPLFCDTSRLYPILLSSGLNTTVLAQIWSAVNVTAPGQLTCQELFLALALIAAMQENPHEYPSLQKLYAMTVPPTPLLHFSTLPSTHILPQRLETNIKLDVLSSSNRTNPAHVGPSDDDFSDFQSGTIVPDIKDPPLFFGTVGKQLTLEAQCKQSNNIKPILSGLRKSSMDAHNESIVLNVSGTNEESKIDWTEDFQSVFDEVASTSSSDSKAGYSRQAEAEHDLDDFKTSPFDTKPKLQLPLPACSEQNLWNSILNEFSLSSTSSKPSLQTPQNSSQSGEVKSKPESKSSETNSPKSIDSDRYNALKELHLDTVSPSEDDFGEFKSHSNPNVDSSSSLNHVSKENAIDNDVLSLWAQVLQASKQVLHKTFNVLVVDHGESCSIEALRTEEGHEFCLDLLAVFSITKRISKRFRESGRFNGNIMQLLSDVEVTYGTLTKLFAQAGTEISADDDGSETSDKICTICFCRNVGKDCAFIYFAGHDYHSSCANFWLNCIDPSLPTGSNHDSPF